MLKVVDAPEGSRRPSTKQIYDALKKTRNLMKGRFGDDVKCRYKGCPPVTNHEYCKRPLKVLEYLWDFSFSRFDIPRAIEQCGALSNGSRYELLFVAESELGDSDEVCRDLLKLLDARARIRCLVYNQYARQDKREELQRRIVRVMHSHACFDPKTEEWLFVGLAWRAGQMSCNVYTLNNDASAFEAISGTA